jgi:hypothetical protein
MPKYMIERTMPGAGDLTPQIREHARLGGFAADSIAVITEVVDPSTAESCSTVIGARS